MIVTVLVHKALVLVHKVALPKNKAEIAAVVKIANAHAIRMVNMPTNYYSWPMMLGWNYLKNKLKKKYELMAEIRSTN